MAILMHEYECIVCKTPCAIISDEGEWMGGSQVGSSILSMLFYPPNVDVTTEGMILCAEHAEIIRKKLRKIALDLANEFSDNEQESNEKTDNIQQSLKD